MPGIDEPETIGPEHGHVVLPHQTRDFQLQLFAFFAGLFKTRGNGNDAEDGLLGAFRQDRKHLVTLDDDDRAIYGGGNGFEGRKAFFSKYFLGRWIDRKNIARKTAVNDVFKNAVSDFPRIGRGPDNRNRTRMY